MARPLATCRHARCLHQRMGGARAGPLAARSGSWQGLPAGLDRRASSPPPAALPPRANHRPLLGLPPCPQVRGAATLTRYFKAPAPATDAAGWFDTGDVATIDARGHMQAR